MINRTSSTVTTSAIGMFLADNFKHLYRLLLRLLSLFNFITKCDTEYPSGVQCSKKDDGPVVLYKETGFQYNRIEAWRFTSLGNIVHFKNFTPEVIQKFYCKSDVRLYIAIITQYFVMLNII